MDLTRLAQIEKDALPQILTRKIKRLEENSKMNIFFTVKLIYTPNLNKNIFL